MPLGPLDEQLTLLALLLAARRKPAEQRRVEASAALDPAARPHRRLARPVVPAGPRNRYNPCQGAPYSRQLRDAVFPGPWRPGHRGDVVANLADIALDLDRFIQRDRSALKLYLGFTAVMVLSGVAILLATLAIYGGIPEPVGGKLFGIAGTFVACVAGFPLKEYLARRDRIYATTMLKRRWQGLVSSQSPPQAELDRVKDLFWKIYEKRTLG
jgi:hypothetical protein